ncbi:MAG: Fur family transcriptional regulator [Bacillota bacterium]|nr:Fur family transcriptional regulator [Bacillota bacterium]
MLDDKWPDGIKKTRQRECVLTILKNADTPLTALDIYEKIDQSTAPVWLSTVYRVLELLAEKGFVSRTTLIDKGIMLYEINRNEHKHYAVCIHCHKRIALQNCPLEIFTPELTENNFHVVGHKVEMYGYCSKCYAEML